MSELRPTSRSGAVDPIELAGRIQDFRHEARSGKTIPTYSRALYLKEPEWDAVIAALRAAASEKQSPEALKAAYHEGYQDALKDMRDDDLGPSGCNERLPRMT